MIVSTLKTIKIFLLRLLTGIFVLAMAWFWIMLFAKPVIA